MFKRLCQHIVNYWKNNLTHARLQTQSGRLAYVDLMKGILIISVVYCHAFAPLPYGEGLFAYMIRSAKMASFMSLSIFFFKEGKGFLDFLTKKFCKHIIPMVFFVFLLYACKFIGLIELPQSHFGYLILDFLSIFYYKIAMWFLYTLFISSISYYIFNRLTSFLCFRYKFLLSIAIGIISLKFALPYGCYAFQLLTNATIANFSPFKIAFLPWIMLPIFTLLHYARTSGLTMRNYSTRTRLAIAVVSLILWILFAQKHVDIKFLCFGHNYLFFCIDVIAFTMFLWSVATLIYWLPIVSYMGRYSIIVFGIHPLFNTIAVYNFNFNNCILFLYMLITAYFSIPFFKRYLPYFCAQKNLIVVGDDGKVHLCDDVRQSFSKILAKLR